REGVVDRVPIAKLVRDMEMDGPASSGVGDRGREIDQWNALGNEVAHLHQSLCRFGIENHFYKFRLALPGFRRRGIGPATRTGVDGVVEAGIDVLEKTRQVNRVAPARGLLHAGSADEVWHQGGEHIAGVLPADVIEELEGFV